MKTLNYWMFGDRFVAPLGVRLRRVGRGGVVLAFLSLFLMASPLVVGQASLGNGATVEVLGTGTESLLGGDLTDPEDDGDELAGPDDPSWNWKSITSNNEPGFEGGEFAFNVFDNKLGPSNDKWCCDDATEDDPKNITVEFFEPVRLTHFTVSSANDVPARDPQTWQIQGSNDGITFEPIFVHDDDVSQWENRLQVNKYTLDVPALPYTFIRFESTRTADPLHQIGEIEYFGLLGVGEPVIEILGTGAAALIGGDLTDPENDGDEAAGPNDPSWNWESITSNNEPGFGGGEFSFNIFDNLVGGGNDKWCCDNPTAENPLWVDVKFRAPVVLRYFTITSGNDARDREPLTWMIAGSNDGVTYTPIFVRDSPTSIWSDVNQVAKVTLAAPAPPYQYLRYQVSHTAGPLHQLNEIEYFGDVGGVGKPSLTGRRVAKDFVRFDISDGADTSLDGGSVVVKIDDAVVATTMSKTGAVTSFTHRPSPRFEAGSNHTYEITGLDNFGNALLFTGQFRQPVPWFPEEDLPGPAAVEGGFATRYIFNAGTIDSIPSALAAIMAAETPEFFGSYVDVVSEVANHGNAGIFGDPLPYDDEAANLGCCGDDFILLHIGHIRVEEEGEYTFGIHSDDGFAMRIRGGTAVAKSGNGELDPGDPEALVHPANTGDSNTRGTYYLTPGVYRLEFFWWERGGGDHGELYVAKGRFANDSDTTLWQLVGQTAPPVSAAVLGVDDAGWSVISSDPGGDQLINWEGAFADLDATGGPPTVYDIMNIGDPTTNAGVLPFPKDDVGDQDDYAIQGTGKLVVPKTGTYLIGFNSDDGAYLRISGQSFNEIIFNATGLSFIDGEGDQVTCDCLTGDSNTRAEITLAQGVYDIEVGMFERAGGSFLRVSGAEVGAPAQPVIAKGGAGIVNFPASGLALTDDPVGTGGPPPAGGSVAEVVINETSLAITYAPGTAGATARVARSLDLKTWNVLGITPTTSGSNLVFTIPRSATDSNEYFRILEP